MDLINVVNSFLFILLPRLYRILLKLIFLECKVTLKLLNIKDIFVDPYFLKFYMNFYPKIS